MDKPTINISDTDYVQSQMKDQLFFYASEQELSEYKLEIERKLNDHSEKETDKIHTLENNLKKEFNDTINKTLKDRSTTTRFWLSIILPTFVASLVSIALHYL